MQEVHINTNGQEKNSYDVIVIGSGHTGGWAAKEFCDKGLKTLMLERGNNVEHVKDYPTATLNPWELPNRGIVPKKLRDENPIVSQCYAYHKSAHHFFINDNHHPYIQEKPFSWIRGYQVGGRSLMWGRACARWSKYDFTAPQRFGFGIDWPIRYEDIAPWYSHVEKFMGVSGSKENIPTMPDGEFLPPMELNCVEKHFKEIVEKKFKRHMVMGRWAHITELKDIHREQGRHQCMNRTRCERGCPLGGYFSANSSTIPWALKSGNLTIRPLSVVHSIIYDEKKQKAVGVHVIDANTKESTEYFAKTIFVNASALNTNLILLNSVSNRFPNGLGNDSGILGKYIIFHNYSAKLEGEVDGFLDKYYKANRQGNCIIPNFRNVEKQDADFLGGYAMFLSASRPGLQAEHAEAAVGSEFKKQMSEPGGWKTYMYMQGEVLPSENNHVRLSKDKKDAWGIPQIITSVDFTDNDRKLANDFIEQGKMMLEAAGVKIIGDTNMLRSPGLDIHEMGGVRMGRDPKDSMLNEWNQLHHCKNVFVTDGACMTSSGHQSPTILYNAITARAANHAAEEMKKGNL